MRLYTSVGHPAASAYSNISEWLMFASPSTSINGEIHIDMERLISITSPHPPTPPAHFPNYLP
jgi:hypothetical protein